MSDGAGKLLPCRRGVQKGISEEALAWLVVPRLRLLVVNGAPLEPVQMSDSLQSILETYSCCSWKGSLLIV